MLKEKECELTSLRNKDYGENIHSILICLASIPCEVGFYVSFSWVMY